MRLIAVAPGVTAWEALAPRAIGPGEVRGRTLLSAVSVASELGLLRDGPFPASLGYQTLAVIEEAGPGAGLLVGQRVLTTRGHAAWGVYPAGRVISMPEHVPDVQALAVILGEETHKGLRRIAPQPQERVLVAGAGLLGLLTVFNLTRRGVLGVTVLEPDAARRSLAMAFGAAAACAPGALPHDEFEVGVECSASPAGFAELLAHLRPGGRCAVLSDGNWGALTLPPAFHQRELTISASSDGEDYAAYAAWLWNHADPVLEELFPLSVPASELPDTYARLAHLPRPVGVGVVWD